MRRTNIPDCRLPDRRRSTPAPRGNGRSSIGSPPFAAIASADPIRGATHNDWATLRAGLRLVREVANQAPLRPFIANEIAPGTGKISDQEIDAHIRATGISVHHPLGTCKMGTETDPHGGGRRPVARFRGRPAARGRRLSGATAAKGQS